MGTLASPMGGRWEAAGEQDAGRRKGLSTVGILGQIVTFVGAGEVRSGVGTLASPMGGRWEAAGEQDAGRRKRPHPSSLPPPPLRDGVGRSKLFDMPINLRLY